MVKALARAQREEKQMQQRQEIAKKGPPVHIDLSEVPSFQYPSKWIDDLTRHEENILLTNEWLNDRLIDAGQKLIKECYQEVCGLQSVSVGQALAFNVQTAEFVQVLHTGRGHWVTISTIGYGKGSSEVEVFDSLPPSLTSS